MNKIVYSKDAPNPIGPYSQAILSNNTLYCSGQIALDSKTGEFLNEDVKTQTQKACENIAAVLTEAGYKMQDIVKTTCYLTKMADFSEFNAVYEKYFAHKPARSTVAVFELPKGALVEIEVIAVK